MSPILAYYWLTPVFWIVDELLGANIRTAALDGHPFWKAAYYLFCLGIGFAGYARSDWLPGLGLLEANLNIGLLVLGIFKPYFDFIGRMASGEVPAEAPITEAMVINFIMAAAIWIASLRARLRR